MIAAQHPPNVFILEVLAGPGIALSTVLVSLIALSRDFAPASRPTVPPAMFSHRVLRREDGSLAWQISFDGVDLPGADDTASEDMGAAIAAEARSRLAGVAEIGAIAAYVDLLPPPPDRGFSSLPGVRDVGDEAVVGWESHARDSGHPQAGTALPASLLDQIKQSRAAVPAEPQLKPHGPGHIYGGASDKAHIAYLKQYLQRRADRANASDKRKIDAFLAFQGREGSTAAINTYDSQIVTWGTGWGGLGWLGKVMERATANEALRDALGRAGLRYRGKSMYDVVDIESGAVITGKKEALEAIRKSVQLLYLLIQVARDPESRDAATEAQLITFMGASANFSGSAAVSTQALFNFITHLMHWAPGYVTGCLEWAVPQVGGSPSPERDRQLAVLVGRYFYGKATKTKWVPAWNQFQLYFTRHMKEDGLDCSAEPFIKASSYPTEDPFIAVPLPAPGATAPATNTAPANVSAPAKASEPVKAAEPAPAPAGQPAERALKNKPLAGSAELEAIASSGRGSLSRGDKGPAVKVLQQALLQLKLNVPGGADGDFGPNVERAVKTFQSAHGLFSDGVVGKITLGTLDKVLGSAAAKRPT